MAWLYETTFIMNSNTASFTLSGENELKNESIESCTATLIEVGLSLYSRLDINP
jgi:hypothetical protein